MRLSRRQMLARLGRIGFSFPLAAIGMKPFLDWAQAVALPTIEVPGQAQLSPADEQLLEDLERASFLFFWEQASPHTGLVKDRGKAKGIDQRDVASIAATGFGLTAICIADKRGFISSTQARARVLATLRFLWRRLPHQRGFFYHFINMNTGERVWQSEASSIDTAILLCGVLTCRQHFEDSEIQQLAKQIYERVDWLWLLAGGKLLSHGWRPEEGFLKPRWDSYCELMMIYLLGLGSTTHPLPAETWDAWKRPLFEYDGIRYIGARAPLFVHQYSHAWFDFRAKRDRHGDYFANSVLATEAHRRFCLSLRKQFSHFSEDLWGITASDSARGYVVWGGPPPMGPLDGTLVPCATGGSVPFLARETLRVLRTMREQFGNRAWSRYGFVDAFNPHTNWFDPDIVGINAGITLLMAENARSQFVWNTFMKNEEARRGMDRAGFRPAVDDQPKENKQVRFQHVDRCSPRQAG